MKLLLFIFVSLISGIALGQQHVPYPPRYETKETGLLGDILSHTPDAQQYYDKDKATWGHEATHRANAQANMDFPGFANFYVCENAVVQVVKPPITLQTLAKAIPQSRRYDNYQLYLINAQRWYNNVPTYVIDEWSAYTNGTFIALYDMKDSRRAAESFDRVLEMFGYMIILEQESKKLPSYDNSSMSSLMVWAWTRVNYLYDDAQKHGWLTPEHQRRWDNLKGKVYIVENKRTTDYL